MAIRLEVTKMPLFHNIFKDKENKKKEIRIPKVPIVLSEYDDEIDFEEEEMDFEEIEIENEMDGGCFL
jgi:hypothetical protein